MYLRLGALKDSQGLARQMAIASEQEVALDELIFTRYQPASNTRWQQQRLRSQENGTRDTATVGLQITTAQQLTIALPLPAQRWSRRRQREPPVRNTWSQLAVIGYKTLGTEVASFHRLVGGQ
ncbi:predicted protein [Aspergillus nidulans FGSC A4]|uniref:Uncharacterized protein n=1 Tax=Emericella nidulans (strain FGSC A4 / ATCC 38163 / CBS 112.46 / NRRL 194 / M139) TaxID=227321 RepID=Q5B378_EMENI|nr:hypothetical protein [Aspergillus nidulans FGSC A4]EAA61080.1 predicted protein [Aspergillus nidulans FGSC A4]CBF76302.1 TPA: hypothetical protein ANIA_05002 [Aspergillus nidulans FGSC A4]|eukprot:XP_662606.1 predicted protein [Aspergillus nidulans FGSC A4]